MKLLFGKFADWFLPIRKLPNSEIAVFCRFAYTHFGNVFDKSREPRGGALERFDSLLNFRDLR